MVLCSCGGSHLKLYGCGSYINNIVAISVTTGEDVNITSFSNLNSHMASSEHLQLSNFIKNTHQTLRNDSNILGADAAWKKHCAKEDVLKEYSFAMRELATKYWEENHNKTDTVKSRVQWVYDFCNFYFFKEEILRQRVREQDIARKINLHVKIDSTGNTFNNILKLLDVGSCYNPFKVFSCFDVLPVDIAPASEDVYRCDFLNLNIVDCCDKSDNKKNQEEILKLPQCTFDVVVFSLLLEYLPCPEQRLLCCKNAYELLKVEGLLIIITPDSKHVGANAKFMKSWRYNLARLGFSRIKYEKLPHIHCMAFRKSVKLEIAQRWTKLQNEQDFFEKMLIPQDFNVIQLEDEEKLEHVAIDVENKLLMLNELPNVPD